MRHKLFDNGEGYLEFSHDWVKSQITKAIGHRVTLKQNHFCVTGILQEHKSICGYHVKNDHNNWGFFQIKDIINLWNNSQWSNHPTIILG